MLKYIFLLVSCCVIVFCEDFNCEDNGVKGRCTDIRHCASAKKDLKLNIQPKICSFNGTSLIPNVCCLDTIVQRMSLLKEPETNECAPVSSELRNNVTKQGSKAWQKCLEYQDRLVFPCTQLGYREDNCLTDHKEQLIVGGGGIDVEFGEYPHMALLGYGNTTKNAAWVCGGALISEKYILTAAHCTSSRQFGPVTFAALRIVIRSALDEKHIYKIKTVVKHPDYNSPSTYNDVALLETERNVEFDKYVVPACLHGGGEVPDIRASATGWGALGYKEPLADIMQDVPLWKVPDEKCAQHYQPHRRLLQGYNSTTQMCYGDDGRVRDTCEGDSGGPLQLINQDIRCTYLIIGVTSFGHSSCAQVGYPGIYTRIAPFVPWIESVVWP